MSRVCKQSSEASDKLEDNICQTYNTGKISIQIHEIFLQKCKTQINQWEPGKKNHRIN